jgi:Ser-tRNA(Ala) deacylase AlaX
MKADATGEERPHRNLDLLQPPMAALQTIHFNHTFTISSYSINYVYCTNNERTNHLYPTNSKSMSNLNLSSPTEMVYYTYDGNFELGCDAKVLSCQFIEYSCDSESQLQSQSQLGLLEQDSETITKTNIKTVQLTLDRTVLHAQGGGQPTDTGTITITRTTAADVKILVTKVLLDRATKVATHTGTITTSTADLGDVSVAVTAGDSVKVSVDAANRQILSECHTAGHVVDSAMAKCGSILPSIKAYHFLQGPYVEYKGTIPMEERPALLQKLQSAFQELVEEQVETQIQVLSQQEAELVCNRVAKNYFNLSEFGDDNKDPDTNTLRIVTVAGWPCPCGGTHVKNTGQLKRRKWGITGIRCKKGVVRVKYNQNWDS